eukprot:SAG22_NODE_1391_length_4517_cov_30.127166_3_plen_130_part_00
MACSCMRGQAALTGQGEPERDRPGVVLERVRALALHHPALLHVPLGVHHACVPRDAKPGHQLAGETQGELVSKNAVPDNAPSRNLQRRSSVESRKTLVVVGNKTVGNKTKRPPGMVEAGNETGRNERRQ